MTKYQIVFEVIKNELIKTPELTYFDPKANQIIQVDWSMKGLGTVLLQKWKPIICVSRTLTPAKTCYSNIQRELLSVLLGLERLHYYVFYSKIKAHTDYKPLKLI